MGNLVSVIIPTRNSGRTLRRCLESIDGQEHKDIETIIIDNSSDDDARSISSGHPVTFLSHKSERAKAKNIGLGRAGGEYVCFIDADMALEPAVLKECIAKMGDGVGGIVIPERSIGDSFWARIRDFERGFYAGTDVESARFFRKELAVKAGGFDEDVVSFEEKTLPEKIMRMGFAVDGRIGASILHDESGFKLVSWLRKKYYYGKTMSKARHTDPAYRAMLFLKDRRFYSKPILALGVIALKSLELLATVSGKAASLLKR